MNKVLIAEPTGLMQVKHNEEFWKLENWFIEHYMQTSDEITMKVFLQTYTTQSVLRPWYTQGWSLVIRSLSCSVGRLKSTKWELEEKKSAEGILPETHGETKCKIWKEVGGFWVIKLSMFNLNISKESPPIQLFSQNYLSVHTYKIIVRPSSG